MRLTNWLVVFFWTCQARNVLLKCVQTDGGKFNQGFSLSEPPGKEEKDWHTHTHTHTQTLQSSCLRMSLNASNLDHLKHDKEQKDRNTIKDVREQVRESTHRGCKKKLKKIIARVEIRKGSRRTDWWVKARFLRMDNIICFNYTDRWTQWDRSTKQVWEERVMSLIQLSGDLMWVRSLTFTQTGWTIRTGHTRKITALLIGSLTISTFLSVRTEGRNFWLFLIFSMKLSTVNSVDCLLISSVSGCQIANLNLNLSALSCLKSNQTSSIMVADQKMLLGVIFVMVIMVL